MSARRSLRTAARGVKPPPALPLDAAHWQAIVAAMGLSAQHARVVELVLCDLSNKQIADVMNIGEGTVKDYLKRIAQRTDTRGRIQLAVHVLAVSHQVRDSREPSAKMTSNRTAPNGTASMQAACDYPRRN